MRGAQLLMRFRQDSGDTEASYLWSDATVMAWLNDGQQEAAIRARLLHESQRADVCQYPVLAGQTQVPLHPALYEISHIEWRDERGAAHGLHLTSSEWLDRNRPDWRSRQEQERGEQRWAIQQESFIRLAVPPRTPGTLALEGYRLPMAPICADNEPEIHRASHDKLVLWAIYRAFDNHDTEKFDATKAARAQAEFSNYFGLRPDADLRRQTREDVPHHNQTYFA